MKIFIASDHAGFLLKEILKQHFKLVDLGCNSKDSCDYPIFAHKLAESIKNNDRGILICGTGIGMSITANKHKNIRAALCNDIQTAELSRKHNNANVIVLGARIISTEMAINCIKIFLNTAFEGGRHLHRLNLINNIF